MAQVSPHAMRAKLHQKRSAAAEQCRTSARGVFRQPLATPQACMRALRIIRNEFVTNLLPTINVGNVRARNNRIVASGKRARTARSAGNA